MYVKVNDKKGDYFYFCFIEVFDDIIMSNCLYVSEFYFMNFFVDMVVLSVCEIGLGELLKGEGVISFFQVFLKAGVRSFIIIFWCVSDQAFVILMNSFYKYLYFGKIKDVVLCNVKLDYLYEVIGRGAYFFFWVGYVVQGDMVLFQFFLGYFIWWICLFLLVLFVILGGLIRLKRYKVYVKN